MKHPANFTPLLLIRIRRAAGIGLSAEKIALKFHRETAFIEDVCRLHGIAITGIARAERTTGRALASDQSKIGVVISNEHLTRLEREAMKRGTSAPLLAGELLNLIAQDGLFGAVLDA